MNRRQKIIVSVTGIFIVLLALVGLTYAYFLTRIQGNTNNKSISVTTANLALTYADGTADVIDVSAITPGMEIGTKEFTVTNTGDDSSYVVVLENVSVKYASDGTTLDGTVYREGEITSFARPQDFVYTLTCETNKSDTTCDGLEETVFPSKDGIVIGNEIKKGDVHSYTLTLTYKYENVDQSDDMNKTLNAKVNIKDIKSINPYAVGEESTYKKSLAYNIINNAALNKNGTELLGKTLTEPTAPISYEKELILGNELIDTSQFIETVGIENLYYTADFRVFDGIFDNFTSPQNCDEMLGMYGYNELTGLGGVPTYFYVDSCDNGIPQVREVEQKVTIKESILSVTNDNYGTSYYYRGAVEDNYVTFSNMCWRIIRIEGDGSVRMSLYDSTSPCSNSTSGNRDNYLESVIYDLISPRTDLIGVSTVFDEWLAGTLRDSTVPNIATESQTKLKDVQQCIADTTTKYDQDGNVIFNYDYTSGTYYTDVYLRLFGENKKATLVDNNCTFTTPSKAFLLTADEVAFAGGRVEFNQDIFNQGFIFEIFGGGNMYGLTSSFGREKHAGFEFGTLNMITDDYSGFLVPSVSLKSSTTITSGDGTKGNPYVVS